MRRAEAALALVLTGACTPSGPLSFVEGPELLLDCEPLEAMAEGEVRAKRLGCTDEAPRNGEGRTGDVMLQSSALQAIFRQPADGLTLVGTPGGGLIDATIPGWRDRLLEVLPVVGGGVVRPTSMTWGVDAEGAWLRLEGPVEAVPVLGDALGPWDAGTAEVTWRLAVDGEVLTLEGADGLYLHGAAGTTPVGEGVYHAGLAWLTDAEGLEDLGGAVVLPGATRLAVGRWGRAHALMWPGGARASGTCAGDRVEVRDAGGATLSWLEPEFDAPLPPGATALVCVAAGHADGAPTPPGEGLALTPGEEGWLWVRVADPDGGDLAAVVALDDGRRFAVAPGGSRLPLGPGEHTLTLHHGPAWDRWSGTVAVAGEAALERTLRPWIDTTGRVLVDLDLETTPSRYARGEPWDAASLAAGAGVGFAVQAAPDEVGTPSRVRWARRLLRVRGGSRAETSAYGDVLSWPWSPNSRSAGHGAVPWMDLGPQEVLALAMGTVAPDRLAVVDPAWVAAAGHPSSWRPEPDLVRLRAPDDLDALRSVFDAGARAALVGPLTWVEAEGGEGAPSAAAVERGLVLGRTVATTGPLVTLELEDERWWVGLQAAPEARVERLELWVDGEVVDSRPVPERGGAVRFEHPPVAGRWALVVARGTDWAVSSPVHLPG